MSGDRLDIYFMDRKNKQLGSLVVISTDLSKTPGFQFKPKA